MRRYSTDGETWKRSIVLGGGQSVEKFADGRNFALVLPKSVAVSTLGGLAYTKHDMKDKVDVDTYPLRYGAYPSSDVWYVTAPTARRYLAPRTRRWPGFSGSPQRILGRLPPRPTPPR